MTPTMLVSNSSNNIAPSVNAQQQQQQHDGKVQTSFVGFNENKSSQRYPQKQSGKDEKIRLNIGGFRHEIMASTIAFAPDTRLYWTIQKRNQSPDYDPETNEYFLDRNPLWFPYILNFYRLGKVHCPPDVCGTQFEEELQYWGIDECYIDSCCWDRYRKYKDANIKLGLDEPSVHTEHEISLAGDIETGIESRETRYRKISQRVSQAGVVKDKFKRKLWNVLEDPNSGHLAQMYAFLSLFFILLSVTTFCLETLPYFEQVGSLQMKLLYNIEIGCITWFTIEYFCRVISCPNRILFLKDIMNWIDLCAIIPFYISICFSKNIETIVVIRVVRLIRVFRILKLSRHSFGLQILGYTLKASCRELCLLACFLSIGVVIFSSLIYYAEKDTPGTKFSSIPTSFWWAIVTMTTVGYGDVVPKTFQGKVIGALCALSGVLVVALPVPVVVSNFSLFYSHAQSKLRPGKHSNKNDNVSNMHSYFLPNYNQQRLSIDSNISTMKTSPCDTPPTNRQNRNIISPFFTFYDPYTPGSSFCSPWQAMSMTHGSQSGKQSIGKSSVSDENLEACLEGDSNPQSQYSNVATYEQQQQQQQQHHAYQKQHRQQHEQEQEHRQQQQQQQNLQMPGTYFFNFYNKRLLSAQSSNGSTAPLLRKRNSTLDSTDAFTNDNYLSTPLEQHHNSSIQSAASRRNNPCYLSPSVAIRNRGLSPDICAEQLSALSPSYDSRLLSPLSSSLVATSTNSSTSDILKSSPISPASTSEGRDYSSPTSLPSPVDTIPKKKHLRRRNAIRYPGTFFDKPKTRSSKENSQLQINLSPSYYNESQVNLSSCHSRFDDQTYNLKEVSRKLEDYIGLSPLENSSLHSRRKIKRQLATTAEHSLEPEPVDYNAGTTEQPPTPFHPTIPTLAIEIPSDTNSLADEFVGH